MFYAVKVGRIPGIYTSWNDCQEQVKDFSNPQFRKFETEGEAEEFINGGSNGGSCSRGGSSRNTSDQNSSREYAGKSGMPMNDDTRTSVMETMIDMKASIRQLQQQTGIITQTLSQLADGLTTLERTINVCESPNVKGRTSRIINNTNNTPLKRSFSTNSTQDDPPSKKKASIDAWVNDNFSGKSFDDSEGVEVYTDGSCFNNGKNGACGGIGIFWGIKHSDNISEKLTGRQTNNRAEIHAARLAIEQAKMKKIQNLILYTDSAFLINSITKWIKGWKRNGWILCSGKPVVNKEDFQELDTALKGINVKWVHVKGHSGIPGNEAADSLANEGAKKPPP